LAVPPGDYTIEYAAGTYWYDTYELFGPDTVYYRADGIYSFYEGEEVDITLDIYGGTGIPSTDVTSEYGY
jgi:molybdopterin biosynthesis enzyme MoaB